MKDPQRLNRAGHQPVIRSKDANLAAFPMGSLQMCVLEHADLHDMMQL